MPLFEPFPYQARAIDIAKEKDEVALLFEMGMGKTIVTLSVLKIWLFEYFESYKVLVVAPKRVAETVWPQEAKKWEHLKDLEVSVVVGNPKAREKALKQKAHIYVIGVDNLAWLVKSQLWDFDTVVLDELSGYRNMKSQRYKVLSSVRSKIKKIIGLTGTFIPKGLLNAFPQMKLIDRGKSLGPYVTKYKERYFNPGRRNGHIVYDWVLKEGAEKEIYKRLDETCISLLKKDHLALPDKIYINLNVSLDTKSKEIYKLLKKEYIYDDIIAASAGVLEIKLQQLAQGAIYNEDRNITYLHDAKLDMLEELVEELQHKPMIVVYAFEHDRDRILANFSQARVLANSEDLESWNRGEIEILLLHPKSAGHGLNLQYGGNILCWFGLTRDLELYQQVNDRLHRVGQNNNVYIYHIITEYTVDEKYIPILEQRAGAQEELMEYLKMEEH